MNGNHARILRGQEPAGMGGLVDIVKDVLAPPVLTYIHVVYFPRHVSTAGNTKRELARWSRPSSRASAMPFHYLGRTPYIF